MNIRYIKQLDKSFKKVNNCEKYVFSHFILIGQLLQHSKPGLTCWAPAAVEAVRPDLECCQAVRPNLGCCCSCQA